MVGSMRLQYALIVKEASSMLGCMNRSTVSRLKEVIIPLYSTFIRPLTPVLAPPVQERSWQTEESSLEASKILGLEHLPCEGRLRDSRLVQPREEMIWGGDLAPIWKLSTRQNQAFHQVVYGWRMRNNRNKGKREVLTRYEEKCLSPWGQSSSRTGYQKILYSLHPWRFSRPWGTWSGLIT